MPKSANDPITLINFVKSLSSVRDIEIYLPGEAERTPSSQLSPVTRRLLIRENNKSK